MTGNKPFVITIVGAESSGKTTLVLQLADHFRSMWVPEYAREYLSSLERPYDERDLEIIAERQLEAIVDIMGRGVLPAASHDKTGGWQDARTILIIDGGMLNLRMWAKIKYKSQIPVVEEAMKDDVTDLYLLCSPLKVWTPDPLREAPDLIQRSWIYNQYLEELVMRKEAMEIVSGGELKRLKKAIRKIEYFFQLCIK